MVYLTIMFKAFRQSPVYRINVITRIISSMLGLLVTVSLWSVLLAGGRKVQGVQLPDMLA